MEIVEQRTKSRWITYTESLPEVARTKAILSCRAVQLVRFTEHKQAHYPSQCSFIHIHPNESLSFKECLRDMHNYSEMGPFVIL